MNELIKLKNDFEKELTLDSRDIAELTGKRHFDVIKDIEKQLPELEGGVRKFSYTYTNEQNNQEYLCYKLPYRETLILISGYSIRLRTKIIDRWIELENKTKTALPKTFSEALRLAADQAEKIESLQIESNQKTGRINLLIHDKKTYTAGEIAKELNLKSATELNNILENKEIQYKQNGTWLLHAKYSGNDYESIKQQELDNGRIIYNRHWTGKGRDFILNLFDN